MGQTLLTFYRRGMEDPLFVLKFTTVVEFVLCGVRNTRPPSPSGIKRSFKGKTSKKKNSFFFFYTNS